MESGPEVLTLKGGGWALRKGAKEKKEWGSRISTNK